jgi:Arc/MetJ-type ribon-helix-helix transcriptional regulator
MLRSVAPRPRKRGSQHAVRRNISLPPELDRIAEAVASKYAFGSFSDYIQARMRKDWGIDLPA